MTLTIELTPEQERGLVEAKARGIDIQTYLRGVIDALIVGLPQPSTETPETVLSGAEAIKLWQEQGLLGSYGDPDIDSPELARQIREAAETRDHAA